MIAHLSGRLVQKKPTSIVVECGGVGYLLNISLYTHGLLPKDENIFIYTHLLVREDAHTLYGFMEETEREVFLKLISVSGIGASTARIMLSSLSPTEVIEAITTGDVPTIKSVKGIGAKTAQRVIIDLKDKLSDIESLDQDMISGSDNRNREEALSALETLGYKNKKTHKIIRNILQDNKDASVETIIKLALKKL